MNILLSSMGVQGILIWDHSANGQYSIKTGYLVARQLQKQIKGDEWSSIRKDGDEEKCGKKYGN